MVYSGYMSIMACTMYIVLCIVFTCYSVHVWRMQRSIPGAHYFLNPNYDQFARIPIASCFFLIY